MVLGLDILPKDLITAISVFISAMVLVYTWRKDQQLRKKEYADKIRFLAGTIIAKFERWKELSLRFFEDIQPLITETDNYLVNERDLIKTRDFLWIGLTRARIISSQRILDEKIENAYVDLYGYDPRIEALFSKTIEGLKTLDRRSYESLLEKTQMDIIRLGFGKKINNTSIANNRYRPQNSQIEKSCSIVERSFNLVGEDIKYEDLKNYLDLACTICCVNINRDSFLSQESGILNQISRPKEEPEKYNAHITEIESSKIGNTLRETCYKISLNYKNEIDICIAPFRGELIKLIRSSDQDIFDKKIEFMNAEELNYNQINAND
jgi:hypothetical protein